MINRFYKFISIKTLSLIKRSFQRLNEWSKSLTLPKALIFILTAPLKVLFLFIVSIVFSLIGFSQIIVNSTVLIVTLVLESFLLGNLILLVSGHLTSGALVSLYEIMFFGSPASQELLSVLPAYTSY